MKQLERLLAIIGVETDWATTIADWIDEDVQPGFPNGAEDSVYTSENPPHLAANMPITRVSEIMYLVGFGPERYAKLKPYVAALPLGTPLNVCTASGPVLDSLLEGQQQFSLNPAYLTEQRKNVGCFPTLNDVKGAMGTGRLRQGAQLPRRDHQLLRRDRMGHYWHHRVHPVQSARARRHGPVRPILRSFGSE